MVTNKNNRYSQLKKPNRPNGLTRSAFIWWLGAFPDSVFRSWLFPASAFHMAYCRCPLLAVNYANATKAKLSLQY